MKGRKKAFVIKADCVACGCCVKICPCSAIRVDRGLFAFVEEERCVGCGKCAAECPASVICLREASFLEASSLEPFSVETAVLKTPAQENGQNCREDVR